MSPEVEQYLYVFIIRKAIVYNWLVDTYGDIIMDMRNDGVDDDKIMATTQRQRRLYDAFRTWKSRLQRFCEERKLRMPDLSLDDN